MIGRSHPWMRRLRALRKDPAAREREGLVVAEGIHLAIGALDSDASIEAAFVSPRLAASDEGRDLRRRLDRAGVVIHETSEASIEAVQDARSPQPVVVVVRRALDTLADALRRRGEAPLVVLACDVQDPGNLGSLLRSADAAGATGFVAVGSGADPLHPRTVRASMGSIFRVPVAKAGCDEAFDALARAGITAIGTDPRAERAFTEEDWRPPRAIVLGSEGGGLSLEARRRLTRSVSVPMANGVESIAVPAAGAVVLFEAARQRRAGPAVTPNAG